MSCHSLAHALDTHRAELSACRRCALVPAVIPIVSQARHPTVMLVGQAPGKTEMTGQRPFAGRAGRTLFQWFARIGLTEEQVRRQIYIAAVTRCYPGPSPSGRGDRVPSREERERCAPWLDAELRLIRPQLIIPVGGLAIARFLSAAPLDRVIGRMHHVTHDGGTSRVIPLPHPSGASSWIHQRHHGQLLDAALQLIHQEAQTLHLVE